MWGDNLLIFQKLGISGACYIYWSFKLSHLFASQHLLAVQGSSGFLYKK
jgi:hypothetical protein